MKKKLIVMTLFMGLVGVWSCSELPDHRLDVEFRYELTCSDVLLKYVIPEVTVTDVTGAQRTFMIEDKMWGGNEHKTWSYSVHYDSLNVSNTMTVSYIPRKDIVYQDEPLFDNVHNLSCLIITQEDGNGRRNNYTIVPDFPSKTNVKADALRDFVSRISQVTSTRGGSVDLKGEITKIENN